LATAASIAANALAARSRVVMVSRVGAAAVVLSAVRRSLHHLIGEAVAGVGVAPRDGVQREHLSGEAGQVVLGGEPYAPEHGDDRLPSRVEQGGVELHGSLSQPGPFPALYLCPTTYTRSSKAPARGNDPRFAYAGCPA